MRKVPDTWLFEPWRMPAEMQLRCGLRVGGPDADIPTPLVDLERATRLAKVRLFALRAQPEVKAAKAAIVRQHGSRTFVRKRGGKRRRGRSLLNWSCYENAKKNAICHSNSVLPVACRFQWRKKWEKVWAEVKYCSERCKRGGR